MVSKEKLLLMYFRNTSLKTAFIHHDGSVILLVDANIYSFAARLNEAVSLQYESKC